MRHRVIQNQSGKYLPQWKGVFKWHNYTKWRFHDVYTVIAFDTLNEAIDFVEKLRAADSRPKKLVVATWDDTK